jgi:putative glutamine amidotransferase
MTSSGRLLLWLPLLALAWSCQVPGGGGRPLIGITSTYQAPREGRTQAATRVNFRYIEAVLEGGGIPVILPTVDDEEAIGRYVERLDGLVLIGGADIPPAAYGEKPHATVRVMPGQRYAFERRLIARWLATQKPVLGICLGMQFTNVVAGGSLIQDIPDQVGTAIRHRGEKGGLRHEVEVVPGTRLAGILGTAKAEVYSSHHQAVRRVAPGLQVCARSADGVVEALERSGGGFGLFVQWHPEQMPGTPMRRAIFSAFVQACRHSRGGG